MKRIFITGGTGFFGKSMLDYRLRHPEWAWAKAEWVVLSRSPRRFQADSRYLANQPGVSFVAGDIRDFDFPKLSFDAIIHAAASPITDLSDEEQISVMTDGARRVIGFANAVKCETILFTSSGAVYGPRTSPAREEDACCPATAYGKGKLAAERVLLESGLDVKIARCFAFVGPYLDRRAQYAIGNFIQDCLDGHEIIIKGDGTPLRSYLYSDDLVEWLFAILQYSVEQGGVFNVGSAAALSIAETARAVCDALCVNNGIRICKAASSALPSAYVPDITKVRRAIGVQETVPLQQAIRLSAVSHGR